MIVLGINGVDEIFHDASATLVADGKIIASVEEERFNRKKHTNGLPFEAINYCLRKAGVSFAEVDHVGYYLDPDVLLKTFYTDVLETYRCDPAGIAYMANAAANIRCVEAKLRQRFPFGAGTKLHFLNHHLVHASSAYHISGFDRAAVLTVDGSGDHESSTLYLGSPYGLEKVHEFLIFPESLGFIYTIFAAHLGLNWISGPGKLMGLAGYGAPDMRLFNDIILLREDCQRPVEIDLSFFDYFRGGAGLSAKALERFGEPLVEGGKLTQAHIDLAASVQKALERAILHIVRQVPKLLPQEKNLCFSGGVALNVTTNRRIMQLGLFDTLFVPPPAYDGGTSLGCALYLDSKFSGRWRYRFDVYTGPDIEIDFEIEQACHSLDHEIEWERLSQDDLIQRAVDCLVSNKFIGWVQGRMECGPRALGNRSILANAMDANVKDNLNARVKKREGFRPYAPSVLREESSQWFDLEDSPFMLLEATVRPEKRHLVPGIVHVDGTSRPQTVTEQANPRYYRLIRSFFERTGVPMVLNTSFNRHGEPIVNRPEEAIAVLLETELDDLFLGSYHVRRKSAQNGIRRRQTDDSASLEEIENLIQLTRVVAHNRARVTGRDPAIIVTDNRQWSYAAAIRLRAGSQMFLEGDRLRARIDTTVEEGRIGVLFVADDLQTTIGNPAEVSKSDGDILLDVVIDNVPPTGWLVFRNNASGSVPSICTVRSIRTFRIRRSR